MLPAPGIRGIYRDDPRARAAYAEAAGIYRILPRAVCLPADISDLVQVVNWALENGLGLIPRGAGSAMPGGNVGEGVIVDLTRMAGARLEIDGSSRRARTGAGVTFEALSSAAEGNGLRLPPNPSSGRWATLGGMVSTNAAGARSVRYGSVRPWVEGLTLVTADGEVAVIDRQTPDSSSQMSGASRESRDQAAAVRRFDRNAAPAIRNAASIIAERFPRTRKNSSGYALDAYLKSGDLLDLIIGAEGTLGIVTDIEWRLDPIPPCRAGLRVALSSLDQLSEVVADLRACDPSALELLDRTFLDLVGSNPLAGSGIRFSGAEAVLLVELERDDPEQLRSAVEQATARARSLAYSVETAFTEPAAERLWVIRHAASPILAGLSDGRRSLQVVEDACLPIERMSEYVRAVRNAAASQDVPAVMFGHAGDGHIHVNLIPDVRRAGWEKAVGRVLADVTDVVIRLGGTPSGEHGDGRLRAHTLERVYGSEILELFRLIKQSFDPGGVLNPGVLLPTGEPPLTRLKVGAYATPLPADIERGLREIEQSGGYARCRLELAGEVGRQESGVGSQEAVRSRE
jgi:FAD/FMN-containing dehydrogenase